MLLLYLLVGTLVLALTLQGHQHHDEPVMCFQVLDKKRANLLVQTFDYQRQSPTTWTLQRLEIWRSQDASFDSLQLDVFKVSDSSKHQIIDVFGVDVAKRSQFKVWESVDSDLDGCLGLCHPECITSKRMLSDARVPVLCLQDSLVALGYIASRGLVVHSPTSGLFYDSRDLMSSRTYVQAVLSSAVIFARGLLCVYKLDV